MATDTLVTEQFGEQLVESIEGARQFGSDPGQLAALGAKILLKYAVDNDHEEAAELTIGKLHAAGIDEVRKSITRALGYSDAAYERIDYTYADGEYTFIPNWSGEPRLAFGDEHLQEGRQDGKRKHLASSRWSELWDDVYDLEPGTAAEIYKDFEVVVDLCKDPTPELTQIMGHLQLEEGQPGFKISRQFVRDIVDVLVEEGAYDAALLASKYAPSVKNVEDKLLKMGEAGHQPTILNVHQRYLAEGIYAKQNTFTGYFGENQHTWINFEHTLSAGMLDAAADMVNEVIDADQLTAMLGRALPKLVELNHIEVPEMDSEADLQQFADQLLQGIVNGFNMDVTDRSFDLGKVQRYGRTYPRDIRDKSIRSTVMLGLGEELCYEGRVDDAARVKDVMKRAEYYNSELLEQYIAYGHFRTGDIRLALENYRHYAVVVRSRREHGLGFVKPNAVIDLAGRGAVAEALLMAIGHYDPGETKIDIGASHCLALAIAASHGVFEASYKSLPDTVSRSMVTSPQGRLPFFVGE